MNTWSATSGIDCSRRPASPRTNDRFRGRSLAVRVPTGATRALAGAIGAFALLPGAPPPVTAQEIDAGRLAIEEGNTRVGTESYRIWRDAGTIRARARVELQGGGAGSGTTEFLLQADANFRPVLYKVVGEGGEAAEATLTGDRLNLHLTTDGGERWKEFLARGSIALVEPGVAHHYLLVLKALREAAPGSRMTVVVPSRTEQTSLAVTGREADQVPIGDRRVAATRYDIELLGSTRHLWVDGGGRLLRFEDPATGRVSTRLPDRAR